DRHHVDARVDQLRGVGMTQFMERHAELEFPGKLAPPRAEPIGPLRGALPVWKHKVVLAELAQAEGEASLKQSLAVRLQGFDDDVGKRDVANAGLGLGRLELQPSLVGFL